MGDTAVLAAAGGGGERRHSKPRAPHRLLTVSAMVVVLAAALLMVTAAVTKHAELKLSAGLQLTLGSMRVQPDDAPPPPPAVELSSPPPLPAGQPPPATAEAEELDYNAPYEQADMLTLVGVKPQAKRPAGGGGGRPAGGARPSAGRPVVTAESAAARDSGAACGEALYVKKVALLFLTTKRLAHEKLWRLWLWDAAGLVPQQALPLAQEAVCGPDASAADSWQRVRTACAGVAQAIDKAVQGTAAATLLPPQQLYSVYVHTSPDYKGLDYQPLFKGRVIPTRITTWWGSTAIMEAERALLAAALKDPLNERFVLISDTDVPLYDPLAFYQQLMHEDRSRVRACWHRDMSIDRWNDRMATATLKKEHWRKSSQFFSLIRAHAELASADTEVFRAFKERCGGWDAKTRQQKACIPDEHYIPTLLASKGLANETYCNGYGIAWTDWSAGGSHPKSYKPTDVTPGLVKKMRWWCKNHREAGDDAQRMFVSVPELLQTAPTHQAACQRLQAITLGGSANSSSANSSSSVGGGTANSSGGGLHSYAHPLDGSCPLTARKFPTFTALRWRQLFLTSCATGSKVNSKAAKTFTMARDPDVVLLRGTACKAAVQQMTVQLQRRKKRRRRLRRRRRRRAG